MDSSWIYKVGGVVAYLLILVGIGVVASRRMSDMRDYFAGGKKLGFWSVAFSARATGESAWLLLGLTGMGAALGLEAMWVVLGEVLGVAGAWLLLARPFKRLTDRYDSITVPDYLDSRFGATTPTLRLVAAGALVVFVTIYVSAQIDATGTAFESFLDVDYYTGAIVGFAVVVAYITTGGFVAVVWSDVFQGTLMFFGLVALPIVGTVMAGGPGAVADQLAAIDPALLTFGGGPDGWSAIDVAGVVSLSLIGLGFLGSPQIFVRFISLKGEGELARGSAVALVWTLLADSGAVFTGMVGRALLTGPGDPIEVLGNSGESVLPMLVEHSMPLLLVGLYIAVVLSAIMSTVDSLLVVAGSAAVRDVWQKVLHPEVPESALIGRSRVMTVALAGVALAVALLVAVTTPDRTVFWFVIFGWSGIAATFCPTVILSLFWRGLTGRGALAAMLVGFAGVPLFKFVAPLLPEVGPFFAALGELPPAFALSALAGVVVSRLDPAGPPKRASDDLDAAHR